MGWWQKGVVDIALHYGVNFWHGARRNLIPICFLLLEDSELFKRE
jgi:hypothetical protein